MQKPFFWLSRCFVFSLILLSPAVLHSSSPALPPDDSWRKVPISVIVNLTVGDYERFSGKRMNLPQRLSFGIMKRQMKKALRQNKNMTAGDFLATHHKPFFGLHGFWLVVVIVVIAALLAIIIIGVASAAAFAF